eukprot:Ihof_evm7s352 gene=Ihof_evmTU7s352
MESVDSKVAAFIKENEGNFQVIEGGKKILCSLTKHELPADVEKLVAHTQGSKYKKLFDRQQYQVEEKYREFLEPDRNSSHKLVCKLTKRWMNRTSKEVNQHVNGKRFQKYYIAHLLKVAQEKKAAAAAAAAAEEDKGEDEEEELWEPETVESPKASVVEPTSDDEAWMFPEGIEEGVEEEEEEEDDDEGDEGEEEEEGEEGVDMKEGNKRKATDSEVEEEEEEKEESIKPTKKEKNTSKQKPAPQKQ